MRLKLPGILLALVLSLNAAAFDVRAVYVDHRTQVQTLPALEQLAKKAAEGGMNALVMEWEATFPFEDNATLCNRFAFSKSEVRDFINFCQRLGVDVIPLQNCFGHAEYILRHERYAGLREDAKDLSQVCPLRKEAAEKVFRSIFSEIAAAHPSRYIHIGCDETFLLGHCKKCAEYVERHGKSRLFVEYVSLMCDIVRDLGKTPVIWADILLRYPDAAGLLPSDLVVVDWNYGWRPDRFGSIDPLLEKGITMWGASALRSSPDNIYLTQWDKHFRNLREYIPFCRELSPSGKCIRPRPSISFGRRFSKPLKGRSPFGMTSSRITLPPISDWRPATQRPWPAILCSRSVASAERIFPGRRLTRNSPGPCRCANWCVPSPPARIKATTPICALWPTSGSIISGSKKWNVPGKPGKSAEKNSR